MFLRTIDFLRDVPDPSPKNISAGAASLAVACRECPKGTSRATKDLFCRKATMYPSINLQDTGTLVRVRKHNSRLVVLVPTLFDMKRDLPTM